MTQKKRSEIPRAGDDIRQRQGKAFAMRTTVLFWEDSQRHGGVSQGPHSKSEAQITDLAWTASVWKGSRGVGTCQLRSNQRFDPGAIKKHGTQTAMRGWNERDRRRAVGGAKKFLFGRGNARHEVGSGAHARLERAHPARTVGQPGRLRPDR